MHFLQDALHTVCLVLMNPKGLDVDCPDYNSHKTFEQRIQFN